MNAVGARARAAGRVARAAGIALLGAAALLETAHLVAGRVGGFRPPPVPPPVAGMPLYPASTREEGGVLVVRLGGEPAEIGRAHARLLRDEMVRTEQSVWASFERLVPSVILRTAVLDLARVRYRALDQGMGPDRLIEIAAQAEAFAPDPFASRAPTFERFVHLNALYDIALGFEGSPLVGCTSFVVAGADAAGGGALLARTFDFEIDPVFDERKVVFVVAPAGGRRFASVAWAGLVGVISGMNEDGLAVVVHGARAGEPRDSGEPLVHALRRVLTTAADVPGAIAALAAREPMVSHLVIAADASGRAVAIERVPGRPQHVRELGTAAVVTNHLEGPARGDPRNLAVERGTSTRDRRARGEELLARRRGPVTVEQLTAWLRDRQGAGDTPLPPGDRRAIDADLAAHGVVLDTRARRLWVSRGPRLRGPMVPIELDTAGTTPVPPAAPGGD
ncbi:MAG: hypothetical protein IT376_14960 [Polyangiaceae bacterium]|nr:hypothetical protein [Polyangiaceae bacterium]